MRPCYSINFVPVSPEGLVRLGFALIGEAAVVSCRVSRGGPFPSFWCLGPLFSSASFKLLSTTTHGQEQLETASERGQGLNQQRNNAREREKEETSRQEKHRRKKKKRKRKDDSMLIGQVWILRQTLPAGPTATAIPLSRMNQ